MVIESVIGVTIEKFSAWGWKKIKEELSKEKNQSYETRMYSAVVKVIKESTSENDPDKIYQAAEAFIKNWIKNGTCTEDIIEKSLKDLAGFDKSNIERFDSLLFEEITNNEELRKRFLTKTVRTRKKKINL